MAGIRITASTPSLHYLASLLFIFRFRALDAPYNQVVEPVTFYILSVSNVWRLMFRRLRTPEDNLFPHVNRLQSFWISSESGETVAAVWCTHSVRCCDVQLGAVRCCDAQLGAVTHSLESVMYCDKCLSSQHCRHRRSVMSSSCPHTPVDGESQCRGQRRICFGLLPSMTCQFGFGRDQRTSSTRDK